MSDYADPDLVAQIHALHKALTAAWVLLGRCDATLEALASPHLSKADRGEIVKKIRAEIARALLGATG